MPLKNSWFAGKSPQLSKIVTDKSADFFGLADHFFSGPKKNFFRLVTQKKFSLGPKKNLHLHHRQFYLAEMTFLQTKNFSDFQAFSTNAQRQKRLHRNLYSSVVPAGHVSSAKRLK